MERKEGKDNQITEKRRRMRRDNEGKARQGRKERIME